MGSDVHTRHNTTHYVSEGLPQGPYDIVISGKARTSAQLVIGRALSESKPSQPVAFISNSNL